MTLVNFYIVRHGYRSDWETNGPESNSPTGLPRDPQLSAFGEVQAREVANYFKSLPEDQRPTAIFSSPSYRCLQTSKPVAIALGVPIYVEHGISEWYPPVKPGEELHPLQPSARALKAYFPEIDDSWSSVVYPPSRGGEDSAALYDRVAGFLTVFVPEVQRRFSAVHKRVLLVSHAATVIALTCELVGDRGLKFRARCCSLTVLDRKAAPAGNSARARPTVVGDWTVRLLGDDTHLKDGKQRSWGVPDVKIADGETQGQGPASGRKTRRLTH